jgi:hypothetical protein
VIVILAHTRGELLVTGKDYFSKKPNNNYVRDSDHLVMSENLSLILDLVQKTDKSSNSFGTGYIGCVGCIRVLILHHHPSYLILKNLNKKGYKNVTVITTARYMNDKYGFIHNQ